MYICFITVYITFFFRWEYIFINKLKKSFTLQFIYPTSSQNKSFKKQLKPCRLNSSILKKWTGFGCWRENNRIINILTYHTTIENRIRRNLQLILEKAHLVNLRRLSSLKTLFLRKKLFYKYRPIETLNFWSIHTKYLFSISINGLSKFWRYEKIGYGYITLKHR